LFFFTLYKNNKNFVSACFRLVIWVLPYDKHKKQLFLEIRIEMYFF
jgi:hypothetical protein